MQTEPVQVFIRRTRDAGSEKLDQYAKRTLRLKKTPAAERSGHFIALRNADFGIE